MNETLPTLYEYYTKDKILNGLSDNQPTFLLNNKPITIYSGAVHYFRVHPVYWRDRLKKLRAAGLNCVETYIPWNLHESEKDHFDFGEGGTDFQDFLNIKKFLQIAQEEDLFVILRPGPYICAEWEFGGLPSWILRDKTIKIRTSDGKFIKLVRNYYKQLLSIVVPLQFQCGGPIVAFQIENEYGNTKHKDIEYLKELKNILIDNGINELLFTSDTPSNGFDGTIPGVLATANFQTNPIFELQLLKHFQKNKPLMVMEYWTGWFDHWTEKHHRRSTEDFGKILNEILNFDASVNFYMFHGGTNWGFLNGANIKDNTSDNSGYQPDTSSYDYDAPLSEAGDYTEKYYKLKEIIGKYSKIKIRIPEMPSLIEKIAYNAIKIDSKINLNELLKTINSLEHENLLPMELLPINNNNGQSYGYIIYRKKINIPPKGCLKIEGHVCDTVLVLINGILKSNIPKSSNDLNNFGFWSEKDSIFYFDNNTEMKDVILDLVVENFGRVNYGKLNQFNQYKGLWQGNVLLNGEIIKEWIIFPLEFKRKWLNTIIKDWKKFSNDENQIGPQLYKANLNISNNISDSFIDLRNWTKGMVIVNGFILTRYWNLGPQLTAYLPAPLLKQGNNEILIFEHYSCNSDCVEFCREPIFIDE